MKQGLQLRLSQQLAMTPQLQQAIRLLQLSTLELQQELQQALESNPLLEQTDLHDEVDSRGQDTKRSIPSMLSNKKRCPTSCRWMPAGMKSTPLAPLPVRRRLPGR
jgi:DNA-directed RNA polymerase specialized sigma54-like protein